MCLQQSFIPLQSLNKDDLTRELQISRKQRNLITFLMTITDIAYFLRHYTFYVLIGMQNSV